MYKHTTYHVVLLLLYVKAIFSREKSIDLVENFMVHQFKRESESGWLMHHHPPLFSVNNHSLF